MLRALLRRCCGVQGVELLRDFHSLPGYHAICFDGARKTLSRSSARSISDPRSWRPDGKLAWSHTHSCFPEAGRVAVHTRAATCHGYDADYLPLIRQSSFLSLSCLHPSERVSHSSCKAPANSQPAKKSVRRTEAVNLGFSRPRFLFSLHHTSCSRLYDAKQSSTYASECSSRAFDRGRRHRTQPPSPLPAPPLINITTVATIITAINDQKNNSNKGRRPRAIRNQIPSYLMGSGQQHMQEKL